MMIEHIQNRPMPRRSALASARKVGHGVVAAAALAALTLTTVPKPAYAGHPNTGAAIGLGILGGVIAGTAIAAATTPTYAAPPPAYYSYPPQGYYYPSAPTYYGGQPAYGWTGYSYPQYGYQ